MFVDKTGRGFEIVELWNHDNEQNDLAIPRGKNTETGEEISIIWVTWWFFFLLNVVWCLFNVQKDLQCLKTTISCLIVGQRVPPPPYWANARQLRAKQVTTSFTTIIKIYNMHIETFKTKKKRKHQIENIPKTFFNSASQTRHFTAATNAIASDMPPGHLPWCPCSAPVEIYNFLVGCP